MKKIKEYCETPEKLWELAEKHDYKQIIEMLMAKGVGSDNLGEILFAYANQAVSSHRYHAAKSILNFLVNTIEDKTEAPPLLILLGDLCVLEHKYLEARYYYAQLPLTFENIEKVFNTFVLLKDIEGLLSLRDTIINRVKDEDHVIEIHKMVHSVFIEIAGEHDQKKAVTEQYSVNLRQLHQIDSAIVKKISTSPPCLNKKNDPPALSRYVRVLGQVYQQTDGIWTKLGGVPQLGKFSRQNLRENENIAVRCSSYWDLKNLFQALKTNKPSFYKFLCYLIVDLDLLENYMAVEDISSILNCDFIIKIIDENEFEAYFEELLVNNEYFIPSFLASFTEEDIAFSKKKLIPVLDNCRQKINIEIRNYEVQLAKLYPHDFYQSIERKIRNKSLRILLQTSNYTTFLRYASRDIADGFKELGYETFIETEKDGYPTGIRSDVCMRNLVEFRPDFIFNINHLRYEYDWIPKTIPYITWVQDEMPKLFSQKGASTMTELDFIYSVHPDWTKLLSDYGYNGNEIGDLTLGVNNTVFHPKALSGKDLEKYGCDISYVANCSKTAFEELQEEIKTNPSELHKIYQDIYNVVCDSFSNGKQLFGFQDYMKIVEDQSVGHPIILHERMKKRIATRFWHFIGSRIFRQQPLEWLSEAGYDLALYGNGWQHHPILAKHAKGWINNGIDLNKLFNASRINLSVHQTGNYASRVFDGIASGGFFLLRYHPADFDHDGLCKMIDLDYELISFKSKKELLEKVDLYLKSPELKNEIVNPLRQRVLEQFSYREKMKNVLNDVSERLSRLMLVNNGS